MGNMMKLIIFISQTPVELRELLIKFIQKSCFSGDATRTISEGGFYINQNRCTNVGEIISPTVHILANQFTLLRIGKRNYHIVQWTN